jgi:hypothetical protein
MTPKQKALTIIVEYHVLNLDTGVSLDAKKCALIAVNNIIEVLHGFAYTPTLDYWKEVKEELEKL